jgi:hypothetical protein
MNSHQAHKPASTYRVLVTDQITPALAGGDGRHYESPPQSEQQARAFVAMLAGADQSDHCGPWRQAIAGGQRIIELRAER